MEVFTRSREHDSVGYRWASDGLVLYFDMPETALFYVTIDSNFPR